MLVGQGHPIMPGIVAIMKSYLAPNVLDPALKCENLEKRDPSLPCLKPSNGFHHTGDTFWTFTYLDLQCPA